MDKANLTTYVNGALLALFSYLGLSQTTADGYVQILAPIISIILAYGMSYLNEKYPSTLVTNPTEGLVKPEDDSDLNGI